MFFYRKQINFYIKTNCLSFSEISDIDEEISILWKWMVFLFLNTISFCIPIFVFRFSFLRKIIWLLLKIFSSIPTSKPIFIKKRKNFFERKSTMQHFHHFLRDRSATRKGNPAENCLYPSDEKIFRLPYGLCNERLRISHTKKQWLFFDHCFSHPAIIFLQN